MEIEIARVQRHVNSRDDCIPNNKPRGSDLIYGMTRHKRNSSGILCVQEQWIQHAGKAVKEEKGVVCKYGLKRLWNLSRDSERGTLN